MEEMYYQVKSYVLQGVALLLELMSAMSGWVQDLVGTAAEKAKDCAYGAEQKMLCCGEQVFEKVKATGAQARECGEKTLTKVKDFYEANKKAILITAAAVAAVLTALSVLCCVLKCKKKD